ncbi:ABC transporter ATP-binding protein [Marinomonas epiphytica]
MTSLKQELASVDFQLEQFSLLYNGTERPVIDGLSMTIKQHGWTCILGRSGCGKSSLLRYLAGLLNTQVTVRGQPNKHAFAEYFSGKIAYMAQQDLLYPWLTVMENVCIAERFKGGKQSKTKAFSEPAREVLKAVGLAQYASYYPQQLSGGMRQRAALARTLLQDKPIILMDEPFSALDAITRHHLQSLAHQMLKHKAVVLITHDPQEAVRLADTVYILSGNPSCARKVEVPISPPPRTQDATTALCYEHILSVLQDDLEGGYP